MCGIAGFFDTAGDIDVECGRRTGQAMARSLAHRGPDDEGVWQDEAAGVVLGFRRLAIIDLSAAGHQPMISAGGRYVVVFNGEIYNFRDLATELEGLGVIFRGRSDTEVMLAAFEQWGVDAALQKINGMFAIALWDRKTRSLHLMRDRLGKKPVYAGWAGKTLLFASELKAFHAHPAFRPAVSRDALALYMRYACVPAPYSIYEGVWQIPPGCRLAVTAIGPGPGTDLSLAMDSYWRQSAVVETARRAASPASDVEAIESFGELLGKCVRQRMVSDVPLGALLSGGIDSSLITALMQQNSERPVKTFTIGFNETGFDETASARAVARHLHTEHHDLYVGPDEALEVIPHLSDIYDEPFADESQIPTFILSRLARLQVTVALTGDGGDEMFGGYARHFGGSWLWRRTINMHWPARRLMAAGIRAVKPAYWDRLRPANRPRVSERLYRAAGMLATEKRQELYKQLVSRWDDPQALVPGSREIPVPLDAAGRWPRALDVSEQMMYADALSYLPDDILVKVDRASMAVGLECRAPLLDSRIFEFAWSLPLSMKIRDGKGKWLMRQLLARYIPPAMFDRPKQGFAVPIAAWLQGPLKDWAASLLDETRLRQADYLDADAVQTVWRQFQQGQTHNADRLWTVLMFESWRERWTRCDATVVSQAIEGPYIRRG